VDGSGEGAREGEGHWTMGHAPIGPTKCPFGMLIIMFDAYEYCRCKKTFNKQFESVKNVEQVTL